MAAGMTQGPASVMRKIVVGPVFPHRGINLREIDESPGLSGTEFSQIMVARHLQEALPHNQVELVSIGFPITVGTLRSAVLKSFANFSARDAVLIVSVEQLSRLTRDQVADALIIVVSHHPHDQGLKIVRKRFKLFAVVHVSRYSYWSNFSWVDRMVFIPNLLPTGALSAVGSERDFEPGLIGFVGALVPAKRFLDLARAWPSVSARSPSARLEVVGSASLYRDEDTHPELPTSKEYGDAILSALGVRSISELPNVKFLGNVSENKAAVMNRWQMAVVNPSGNTESFCYSLRELLLAGIPTIGGARQGMSEVMERFSHLALRRADRIEPTILRVLEGGFDLSKFEIERQRFIRATIEEQNTAKSSLSKLAEVAALPSGHPALAFPVAIPPLLPASVLRALVRERMLRFESLLLGIRDRIYSRLGKRFLP